MEAKREARALRRAKPQKNTFRDIDYELSNLKPKKTNVEDLGYPTFANTLNLTQNKLQEETQKE